MRPREVVGQAWTSTTICKSPTQAEGTQGLALCRQPDHRLQMRKAHRTGAVHSKFHRATAVRSPSLPNRAYSPPDRTVTRISPMSVRAHRRNRYPRRVRSSADPRTCVRSRARPLVTERDRLRLRSLDTTRGEHKCQPPWGRAAPAPGRPESRTATTRRGCGIGRQRVTRAGIVSPAGKLCPWYVYQGACASKPFGTGTYHDEYLEHPLHFGG